MKQLIERLKGLQRWSVTTIDNSADLYPYDKGHLVKHDDIQAIIDELEAVQEKHSSIGVNSTSKPFCDQTRERLAKMSQDHFEDAKSKWTDNNGRPECT